MLDPTGPPADTDTDAPASRHTPWQEQFAQSMREAAGANEGDDQ